MNDEVRSAADQLGISPGNNEPKPAPSEDTASGTDTRETTPDNKPRADAEEKPLPDSMKRRGFFEAVRQTQCPQAQLAVLLKEYEQQARDKIMEADELAAKRIEHLHARIEAARKKIEELQQKVIAAEQYREADDPELQQLIKEKEKQELEVSQLLQRVTKVRIRLGEAKAGIITQSLDEAEMQVSKALDIQRKIYDETRQMNQKKFDDEKDHLARLSVYFSELYDYYSKRYHKVHKYLGVLDVDGISPVTSQVLTTIGTIAFGAAGFFFSTFAGYAGFGNQDILSFILGGLIESAKQPATGFVKIAVLLGLIGLITLVSVCCNWLINRLKKKSEEEILSEVMFSGQIEKKLEQMEYQASIKSNNWYAFWLQLIPGVLIAGLVLLALSQSATKNDINNINASSEGLIVGSAIAISLAGLIYLYIIKVVEPRLLRRYDAEAGVPVNWLRSNWELVAILVSFVVLSLCIVAIPYKVGAKNLIPLDQQTRYAILLFTGICLVGSMSFAYSVRNRGLIETNRYLERVMRWLNNAIAYCSAPEVPDVHNRVKDEHGNIIRHVLTQLAFKATINTPEAVVKKRRYREKSFFERMVEKLKNATREEQVETTPVKAITLMEPWEKNYFPHIVDELKAAEFEYSEGQRKLLKAEDNISDHKTAKQTERRLYETELELSRKNIAAHQTEIETVIRERSEWRQKARNAYDRILTDLMDGFHLGIWYRENGMGPKPGYFESCFPDKPVPANLFSSQS
ncbi:MAG: hypothetical protein WCF67_14285 [Chitinophagaceae bacterium]